MQFKLISRTELADATKRQLQFSEVPPATGPDIYHQGVNLNGYFDSAFADGLTVGATYTLTLTKVV